jgi:two-component system nitrogen regulation sensor histidine kinase GlnL
MNLEIAPNLIAYYLVTLVTFVESLMVGVVVFIRNRRRATGVIWGLASIGFGIWCLGFSQYFRHHDPGTALLWAKITLSAAILNTSFYFHGMNVLIGISKQFRIAIATCYLLSVGFMALTWFGPIVTGVREITFLHHYIHYNKAYYPLLTLHLSLWPLVAVAQQVAAIRRLTGYRRNQIIYFLVATTVIFLCTTLIIVPIEYDIAIPPFCFFLLPFNMAFLAYVLAKGRLMEINFAIGHALLFVTALGVVLVVSLVLLGAVHLISPSFLGAAQILFIVFMVLLISATLSVALPMVVPHAEQIIQSRLQGGRHRYQQAITELTTKIATLASADEMLQTIVEKLLEHLKVPRAQVFMQEDLTTDYVARARASLQSRNGGVPLLAENTEVIQWLRRHQRSLVKEEIQFREATDRAGRIAEELERIGASLCVPMILDGQLVGTLTLENKVSGDMFTDTDIKLLERLCSEVALAVRYRKFEQQMFQTSKLASLGTLAAGIAHEIRNPLSSIKTFVQLLPTRPNDAEFQAEFSKLVSSDVDRITKIVENVLSFARSANITIGEQQVDEIIEDVLALINAKLKHKNIEVTKHWNSVPVLRGDKDQLAQVFVNILLNAVEALPDQGGKIKISCTSSMIESPRHGRRKTPHLTIEIADNGPGIPENIKGRLFDPFFTTKPNGTGLGLAISYKVIEAHEGFIQVVSTEGQGAAFQINLPL